MFLPNLQMILEDELRPFVMKGAAWLDEYEPKWVSKIVPDKLNLESTDLCICGQVFGSYGKRPEAVDEASTYGFNLPEYAPPKDGAGLTWWHYRRQHGWAALDALWLGEVWWRLDPDGSLGSIV